MLLVTKPEILLAQSKCVAGFGLITERAKAIMILNLGRIYRDSKTIGPSEYDVTNQRLLFKIGPNINYHRRLTEKEVRRYLHESVVPIETNDLKIVSKYLDVNTSGNFGRAYIDAAVRLQSKSRIISNDAKEHYDNLLESLKLEEIKVLEMLQELDTECSSEVDETSFGKSFETEADTLDDFVVNKVFNMPRY
jgi:hypothetical protein